MFSSICDLSTYGVRVLLVFLTIVGCACVSVYLDRRSSPSSPTTQQVPTQSSSPHNQCAAPDLSALNQSFPVRTLDGCNWAHINGVQVYACFFRADSCHVVLYTADCQTWRTMCKCSKPGHLECAMDSRAL